MTLVRLGATAVDDTLLGALTGCHARIRHFTALAARLAVDDATPETERAEAAAAVVRYFTVALPLHAADEDVSLAPRLRGQAPALDATLDALAADHAHHAALLAPVLAACRAIATSPAAPPAAALAADAAALSAAFAHHLAVEETHLFPAIASLATTDIVAIHAELRARRR